MSRLTLLPVLLIGLPLIGCQGPGADAPSRTVAVPGTDGTTTGSFVKGSEPESPVINVGRDQIDLTQQNTAGDILQHTSAAPVLVIHH